MRLYLAAIALTCAATATIVSAGISCSPANRAAPVKTMQLM